MGGKNLYKYLREKFPFLWKNIPVNTFSGTRVAVDAYIILHACLAVAIGRVSNVLRPNQAEINHVFLTIVFGTLHKFLNNHITPVMVFDGPTRPEKKVTAKRAKQRENPTQELDALLSRLAGVAEENFATVSLTYTAPELKRIRQLRQRVTKMTSDYSNLARDMFESLGICCLVAKHDAEELCSTLAMEGYVSAVYSTDADCLPFGAPLAITSEPELTIPTGAQPGVGPMLCFPVIALTDVLSVLGFTFKKLIDWVIMSGCDFNDNVPQFAVAKALKYLQGGGSNALDVFVSQRAEAKCLEVDTCRRIFSTKVWRMVTREDYKGVTSFDVKKNSNYITAKEKLSRFGLDQLVDKFKDMTMYLTTPRHSECRPPASRDFVHVCVTTVKKDDSVTEMLSKLSIS